MPLRGSSASTITSAWRLEAGQPRAHVLAQLVGAGAAPGRSTTYARGTSPQRSSATPTTAASSTAGCAASTFSTSTPEMFSPPETMRSFVRSTIVR